MSIDRSRWMCDIGEIECEIHDYLSDAISTVAQEQMKTGVPVNHVRAATRIALDLKRSAIDGINNSYSDDDGRAVVKEYENSRNFLYDNGVVKFVEKYQDIV